VHRTVGWTSGATALVLGCLPQASGAGAWPRDDGRTFLSFGTEIVADGPGFTGLYAERGLPRRWTAVLDAGGKIDGSDWSSALSLRRPIDDGTGPDRFALSFGGGLSVAENRRLADVPGLGQARPFARFGAHWGRGIETGWGNGWVAADALADISLPVVAGDAVGSAWKLDATLGLRPMEGLATILQLQTGAAFAGEPYARMQATAVRDLGSVAKIEAGAIVGLAGDDTQALKFGVWLDF
jgi:hypothetical protein